MKRQYGICGRTTIAGSTYPSGRGRPSAPSSTFKQHQSWRKLVPRRSAESPRSRARPSGGDTSPFTRGFNQLLAVDLFGDHHGVAGHAKCSCLMLGYRRSSVFSERIGSPARLRCSALRRRILFLSRADARHAEAWCLAEHCPSARIISTRCLPTRLKNTAPRDGGLRLRPRDGDAQSLQLRASLARQARLHSTYLMLRRQSNCLLKFARQADDAQRQ